jgi:NADH-quinone oxidoreductase subunit J
MLVTLAFYLFAAITIAAGIVVVAARNIVHSAIALIASFFGVAALYVLLDAELLAAIQVLIYVGGITILLLFAIMLTSRIAGRGLRILNAQVGPSAAIALGLLAVTLYATARGLAGARPPAPADAIAAFGTLLVTTYALPFEVVSVLLLAALVGAILLARREP